MSVHKESWPLFGPLDKEWSLPQLHTSLLNQIRELETLVVSNVPVSNSHLLQVVKCLELLCRREIEALKAKS